MYSMFNRAESYQIGVQELNNLILARQRVLTLPDRRISKVKKMHYSYNLMRTKFLVLFGLEILGV